jgi:hypothetical protein
VPWLENRTWCIRIIIVCKALNWLRCVAATFPDHPNTLLTDVIVHVFERCGAKRFYIGHYSGDTAVLGPLSFAFYEIIPRTHS